MTVRPHHLNNIALARLLSSIIIVAAYDKGHDLIGVPL